MDVLDFQKMMIKIYALFGKTRPNNEILDGIFESVCYIPTSAIPNIVNKFEQLSELKSGVNIAKLICSFYEPEKKDNYFCNLCMNKTFFEGVKDDGRGGYTDFMSPCPNCSGNKDYPTYSELIKLGVIVMPPNEKRSLMRWLYDVYGIDIYRIYGG